MKATKDYISHQAKNDIINFIFTNGNGAAIEKMQKKVSALMSDYVPKNIADEWTALNVCLLKALHHIDKLDNLSK